VSALLKNPAVIIGLVRALIILLSVYGVKVTSEQTNAILDFLAIGLTVTSLALTGLTYTTTQRKPVPIDEAVVSPSEGEGGGNLARTATMEGRNER